jgi:hypothetical protein
LWHKHYGHLSCFGLEHLSKAQRVLGLPRINPNRETCESCLANRQRRESFPHKSDTRAAKPGQKFHSDLVGPMQQALLTGSKYILVFTDDHSRKSWTFFLRSKDETFSRFRQFKERIEAETGNKMQILCTNLQIIVMSMVQNSSSHKPQHHNKMESRREETGR